MSSIMILIIMCILLIYYLIGSMYGISPEPLSIYALIVLAYIGIINKIEGN